MPHDLSDRFGDMIRCLSHEPQGVPKDVGDGFRAGSDGHDAFWMWLGKKAAKGEMECGNEEAAEQLLDAFMAGWLHAARQFASGKRK